MTANPYAPRIQFTDRERAAMRPPSGITPSEWAERYFVIPSRSNAEPGPYRLARTPYMRDILDAYGDPTVEAICFVAGTQVGKTMSIVISLAWCADECPGPTLFVLPDEKAAVRYSKNKIRPFMEESPRIRSMLSGLKGDWTQLEVKIGGLDCRFTWARSATGLASDPIQYLHLDEVDKFVERARGGEADPVSLARERLRTYRALGISKETLASTPVEATGHTWSRWQESDQHHYHVPCPECGAYQRLVFSRNRLKWPADVHDPERVETERLACYVCAECEADLPDDTHTKTAMLARGVWAPESATVTQAGEVVGGERRKIRGFHLSSLYSPFLTWSDVAAEFLRSKDHTTRLQNFYNSWLGLPWQRKARETSLEHVEGLASNYERGRAPEGVLVITVGCDVQLDVIYYVVRGWGIGERSWLIEAGQAETFEQLEAATLHRAFPMVGDSKVTLAARLLCIDYQYRREEVIPFAMKHPTIVRPTRGADRNPLPIRMVKAGKGRLDVARWNLDVSYFKDRLHGLMNKPRGEPGSWLLHSDPWPEYLRQIVAEHQVLEPLPSGAQRVVWKKRAGFHANHWLDCEAYALAAAEMLQVHLLRDEHVVEAEFVRRQRRSESPDPAPRATRSPPGRIGKREGWVRRPKR